MRRPEEGCAGTLEKLLVSFLYCRRVIKRWSYHAALNIPGCQITASSSGPVWVVSSHQRLSHRKRAAGGSGRVRRASPALSNARFDDGGGWWIGKTGFSSRGLGWTALGFEGVHGEDGG